MEPTNNNKSALVFGITGEQGRAVLEGFVERGYSPVYGLTSRYGVIKDHYLSDALGCTILEGRLGSSEDIKRALETTKAQTIFLTTTTEMATEFEAGYHVNEDNEYEDIVEFFTVLKQVYQEDRVPRTVVFSTQPNVEGLCQKHYEETGEVWIEPLDDGSIVPHFSAKGKGAEEAMDILKDTPELKLILLTTPFFYSNFLAFFAPIPNEGHTQWELCASFGDGTTKLDMMSSGDLGHLVASICERATEFHGRNLRVASERISMEEIAKIFSDLYGKDVIYNPLLPSELAEMEFPSAPAIAQMCQFLGRKHTFENLAHDIDLTTTLLKPRHAATFESWLLTHSDSEVFNRVGLSVDAPELTKICVFGALSPQGRSVVAGLLANKRISYHICATTRRDLGIEEVQEMISWDPKRISFVQADFDDVESCKRALENMDGAFLVADLHHEQPEDPNVDQISEETHVTNVIDACTGRVKHLVIGSFESPDAVNAEMTKEEFLELSPRACAAAYARSKHLSVTFILMPCYSESVLGKIPVRDDDRGREKKLLRAPSDLMYVGVEELGTVAAAIFSSYQCYAGHEIGLITDFVTISEVGDEEQTKDSLAIGDTYMKDLGQLFAGMSHSDVVSRREYLAKAFQLVPQPQNLVRWIEQNSDNPDFREKLGLR